MLATLLAAAGIACIPLSVMFRRAARNREREARKRAALIRERLAEEPQVEPRKAEIRLGARGGR
jgi:hypothetical protein